MRGAHFTFISALALSCAAEETTLPLGGADNVAGTEATAGSDSSAGTGGDGAMAGSGMMTGGGGSTSGAFVGGGQTPVGGGGTFGMLAGSAGTAAGGGGSGGAGGAAGSGSGSGGKAGGGTAGGGTGGSGGKASGGTGGMGAVQCGDNAIRAKAQWTASASDECAPTCVDPNGPFTAALAIDADVGTRFATGKAQAGDEWLQIDLGAVGTVNRLSINTASGTDYTRHYQIRVSSTSLDMGAQIVAEGDGSAGTTTIDLSKTVNGRYILISQTGNVGAATSWWSVNDVTIACQ